MSTLWYCILGAVFVAYFVLGGLDQGVAMLLPAMRGDDARRRALNAIGPMFLGNEVWVVGAAGVLIAAFPRLEAELFHGAYPALIAAVLGLVALNAGVQLRSRGRRRGGFDALIAAAGLTLAGAWGLVFGFMLHGPGAFTAPAVWLTAAANVLLVVAHGAAFLRLPLLSRAGPVAGAAVLLALGGWYLTAPEHIRNPALATALALACAGAAVASAFAPKPWVFTAVACALPVVAAASALFPGVLASTLDPGATVTVDGAAAGEATLRLLALGAAPLLPVLVAVQAAGWWLFRRRTSLYW
ncbi:cytochrome d ubiquinol oxidase subunit II [Dactylosporangium matsuzakiense]|uniref:Cytochrome bd oxidase subunit II n=1 Tax=Dactylosporangium matsuzakiense TaxID=53360 RepID=A0A9W6KHH9_9ACTN|nr:cytochrome d ubiquinol oxidase subunit II [Dactylosporangium matsuzakiense]UWZ46566.1 cytochrome d ubiquinol oxidase subunit II [Dactylosporangium matsuzakiense]GLL01308.1 cytochrome bd oxidase subunit II [Dactylosporangium matsuzakiense]